MPLARKPAARQLHDEVREALVVRLVYHNTGRREQRHAYFAEFWKTMSETTSKAWGGRPELKLVIPDAAVCRSRAACSAILFSA